LLAGPETSSLAALRSLAISIRTALTRTDDAA
jgi:hypothetical protein